MTADVDTPWYFLENKKLVSWAALTLIVLAVILILGVYAYNIFRWADNPDFGYSFRTATGIHTIGVLTNRGRETGFRIGDRILEVNGRTYDTYSELNMIRNWDPQGENTYLIMRDGVEFLITAPNFKLGLKNSVQKSGLPFIFGICYVLIGFLVLLMKPHYRDSWVFFLFAVVVGLFMATLFKVSALKPSWMENVIIFAYAFVPATIAHLALSFPEERSVIKRHPFIQFFPYFISAIIFAAIRLSTTTMSDAPKVWVNSSVIYLAVSLFFFLGSCLQLHISSPSQLIKLRARIILLGFAIASSLPLADLLINALLEVYIIPGFNYYLPFFIVVPLAIGYSIVKHDLFDIDTIIKRTYGYALTTGTIAGIYGLVVLLSNMAFGGTGIAQHPLFSLGFILVIVFLFNPVRNRVQRVIDRVFYRLEYDYRETVQKISETMRSLLNLDEIGKSIMNIALGTMFIDSGSVMILNKKINAYDCLIQSGELEQKMNNREAAEIEMAVSTKPPPQVECLTLSIDEPLIKKIGVKKKAITIYDIQEDPFFEPDKGECLKTIYQLGATLVVPLIYENSLTGLISLGRKKSGKFYRREDINLLTTLANQATVAIENARMVEQVVEKERMEEELNIARDLQVSMLPAECPQIEGFEVAAFSASAREVGGDFYDFIDMGLDKAGMVIGDVTGKSVSGALVMSAARSVFRMLSEDELPVAESMMRANRRLKKDVKTGMFVALLFAVLNSRDRTMTLCSAGQTQPILLSAKTGETVLVQTRGDTFPLGILDEAEYEETQLKFEPGDKIVLYTDGIVEAMNTQEEMFGFERLLELVKTSQAQTTESLLEEIKSDVNEFIGSAPQHDDITIIVVQATE